MFPDDILYGLIKYQLERYYNYEDEYSLVFKYNTKEAKYESVIGEVYL